VSAQQAANGTGTELLALYDLARRRWSTG